MHISYFQQHGMLWKLCVVMFLAGAGHVYGIFVPNLKVLYQTCGIFNEHTTWAHVVPHIESEVIMITWIILQWKQGSIWEWNLWPFWGENIGPLWGETQDHESWGKTHRLILIRSKHGHILGENTGPSGVKTRVHASPACWGENMGPFKFLKWNKGVKTRVNSGVKT